MDRRASLSTLLGQAKNKKVDVQFPEQLPPVVSSGLNPYAGTFGFDEANHLLRRATFGASLSQVKTAASQGLAATMQQLFAATPMPDPPVNPNYLFDPNVPVGATWVTAPSVLGVNVAPYRFKSLYSWQIETMHNSGINIREKMTLFWHNHFVTSASVINDPRFLYKYITTLRSNALGNFKELVELITIDPAMLRYLNGHDNAVQAPNENYARELLELFSIGKGPQVGPGDYTNFTEQDVIQMARVLTGWRSEGYNAFDPTTPIQAAFKTFRHDSGTKELSSRFNNVIISNGAENEYKTLIDIIFQKDEVARFISRKLYRWFVYYNISADVETNVITPMANLLRQNNYNIQPVIEALLKSEHFFDMLSVGPMIKNPVDWTLNILNQFDIRSSTNLESRYKFYLQLWEFLAAQQMVMFSPPDVAGWKAYYQTPSFYRTWINAVTLPYRMIYTDAISTVGFSVNSDNYQIDIFGLLESLDDPYDPNTMIQEIAKFIFPQPITTNQVNYLKEILIPGLPDFEWTVEYTDFLADPSNVQLGQVIEFRARLMIRAMFNMPEYFLS